MTFRFAVFDIQKRFKQTFDDKDIQLAQALYWVQVVTNRLNKLHFDKHDTGLHVTTFQNVAVQIDSTFASPRKFITLPAQIFDLDNEKAVHYITYNEESCSCCDGPAFAQTEFQPTIVTKAKNLYRNKYSEPTPKNPYFYRSKERLYLLGVECISLTDVEIALFVALDPLSTCDLDAELPLPDHLHQTMVAEVINLGRLAFLVPKERVNDGTDSISETVAETGRNIPTGASPAPAQQIEQQTQGGQ